MSLERMDDLFGVTELAKKIEDEEAHERDHEKDGKAIEIKETK